MKLFKPRLIAVSAILLTFVSLGPSSLFQYPCISRAWATAASEESVQYYVVESQVVVRRPPAQLDLAQAVAPASLAPTDVEIAQYGEPEDLAAYLSGSFLGVRFDPPFSPPYKISKIRFPSFTVNGAPATFPSVSLVRAASDGRIEGPPIVRVSPFVGSSDGMNELRVDELVSELGRTYYLCVEFPVSARPDFPNDYPFMRMDFRDQEKGFFANSFKLSPVPGAIPLLLPDRNLVASMVCSLTSSAEIPIQASTGLGANRIRSETDPLGELVFTFTPAGDVRLDGSVMPKNSLRRTDLIYRAAPSAPWIVYAAAGPKTGRIATAPFPSGLLTWAVQAIDKSGHRAVTSNVVQTTNFIPGRPSAAQDDAYEPNGRRQDATAINQSSAIAATYYPAGDLDCYAVDAEPGATIAVIVARSGLVDANGLLPVLRLLDRRGVVVATAIGTASTPNPRLDYVVPSLSPNGGSYEPQRFTLEITDLGGSPESPNTAPRVIFGFPAYVLTIQVQRPGDARTVALSSELASRAAAVSAPESPILLAPQTVTGPEDSPLAIEAFASMADGAPGVEIYASGYPEFLSFSSSHQDSTSAIATLTGVPGPTDSGTWRIQWIATHPATGATDSAVTILEVEDTNLPATADLPSSVSANADLPLNLSVHFVDPNGDPIEQISLGPLPAGAFFDPAPEGGGGTFLWTPQSSLAGEFPVAIRARSRGGATTATMLVNVNQSGGPGVPRVPPPVYRLVRRDHRSDYLLSARHGVTGANLFGAGIASSDALIRRGCELGSRRDSVFTLWCPIDSIPSLFATQGLSFLSAPGVCASTLDSVLVAVDADGIRTAYPPPYSGHQGSTTLVGIVDSGIDAPRPDFIRQVGDASTSRIYRLWDQVIPPYFAHPTPGAWPYGSEYTRQQITSEAETIVERDSSGHGTLVAGVVAGNGRGGAACKDRGSFVGLAPEADLVVVKRRSALESDILNGIDYVFSKADSLGRPAVVNLSLVGHAGAHDGGSIFDYLVSTRIGPGRIVVASAGNDGEPYYGIHASAFPRSVGATQVLAFDVQPYQTKPTNFLNISGWMNVENGVLADSIEITVITPTGVQVGPAPILTTEVGYTVDGMVTICAQGDCSGDRGLSDHSFEIRIQLSDFTSPPASGRWEVWVKPLRTGSGQPIDFYIVDGSFTAGWIQGGSGERTVGSPACADSVIAVGAFTSKDCWESSPAVTQCEEHSLTLGQIASFSSQGPRRDGVIKPEIVAPGAMVASVRSQSATFPQEKIVFGGGYAVAAGTSLSAPAVTGAIALLLAQPDSSWATAGPSRLVARLGATARVDQHTGAVPNGAWGYGKLDVSRALAPVQRLRIYHPKRDQTVGPAPDSINFVLSGCLADSVVFYVAADSCRVYGYRAGKLVNVPPDVAGVLAFNVPDSVSSPHAYLRGYAFAGDYVVAANSEGFFLFTSPTSVDAVGGGVPEVLSLRQIFPNPFNPETTILVNVGRRDRLQIRVFSATGRLIKTLVDGYFPPGVYGIKWDGVDSRGRQLASGVFFVKATCGGRTLTRKVTILR